MIRIYVSMIFISLIGPVYSQTTKTDKLSIDTSMFNTWPKIQDPIISDDGRYIAYKIINRPIGKNTLLLKSISGKWEKSFTGDDFTYINGLFSADSKKFAFLKDNIIIISKLGTSNTEQIGNVSSFAYPQENAGNWIAFLSNDSSKILTVTNLLSGIQFKYSLVSDYAFSSQKSQLLIKAESQLDSSSPTLSLLNLKNGKLKQIWFPSLFESQKGNLVSYSFDQSGEQIALMIKDSLNKTSIWLFNQKMDHAEMRVNESDNEIKPGYNITDWPFFSYNGKYLLFYAHKIDKRKTINNIGDVSVWSFKDAVLQPLQELEDVDSKINNICFSYNINTKRLVQLSKENEKIEELKGGDFAILYDNISVNDYWWSLSSQPSAFLISLADGNRTLIRKNAGISREIGQGQKLDNFSMSPNEKYLIYWDKDSLSYISFELMSGHFHNVTSPIPTQFYNEYIERVFPESVAPIVGWQDDCKRVYIYDNYDLWRVDPTGREVALNVTNAYGKRHGIKLRIVKDIGEFVFNKSKTNKVLFSGFDNSNKNSGFLEKDISTIGDPKLLNMDPYLYYLPENISPSFPFIEGLLPLKAKKSKCWIVQRQSAMEFPNLFYTKNFKLYRAITQFAPQKRYKWLTAELISWKQFDGTYSQGILYKPENFDSTKKYPVIFNYYEERSYGLFEFLFPYYTGDEINIPWFVSKDYLVFVPDIKFTVLPNQKKPVGTYTYNSVVSAAQYLSTFNFVAKERIALQGHSFGGFETNYLITHCNLFCAAAEMAGVTDPISEYLTLFPRTILNSKEAITTQNKMEIYHELYFGTPWQYPEMYKDNSSVLNADKVTTPLLITHNPSDENIQWRQGIELYLALRRLAKPVWMLQYNNSHHSLVSTDQVDYTIRLTEFFNHYLKEVPAPIWMTRGIPASLKGVETGYELDPKGNCYPNCPICKKINLQPEACLNKTK